MRRVGFPTMATRSPGKSRRRGRVLNWSFTSTTEARKAKTLYASKFTSSDQAMQRMLRQFQQSAKPIKAKGSRRAGESAQSIGVTRQNPKIKRNLCPPHCDEPRSPRARRPSWRLGKLQLDQIGVLEERQKKNEILCDFDFKRTPPLAPLYFLVRLCGLRIKRICDSRTRRGWHRVVRLSRSLTPAETVAFQALLGSDRRRESLNLMRVLSLREDGNNNFAWSRWNLMFTRKLKRRN